jgi:3-oxoacyl-(acyl-carrier-protein) synthase
MARGAKIYAELASHQTLCQAHHVTGLDGEAETLTVLIKRLVEKAGWNYRGPQYRNAHGTGTEQNDRSELIAVRAALGEAADNVVMSSNKAVLGHLINAAGSIELALTAMALRDGFAPATMHLQNPETTGQIDCLPEYGVQGELDRAIKLSLAFGGHLVGIALRRCPVAEFQREPLPLSSQARIRHVASAPIRKAA